VQWEREPAVGQTIIAFVPALLAAKHRQLSQFARFSTLYARAPHGLNEEEIMADDLAGRLPRDALARLRQAEQRLREMEDEHRQFKRLRRELVRRAGGPCKGLTKERQPCQRKALASGRCRLHGGKNATDHATELLLKRKRRKERANAQKNLLRREDEARHRLHGESADESQMPESRRLVDGRKNP
jgi:hypothetical protein